jgi:hypothetical protein
MIWMALAIFFAGLMLAQELRGLAKAIVTAAAVLKTTPANDTDHVEVIYSPVPEDHEKS